MGITALSGPTISYGQTLGSTGAPTEYNEQAGPSLYYQGVALLDPRTYYTYEPGSPSSSPTYGWLGTTHVAVLDYVLTAVTTNSVAQTQSSTTTTSRTLTLTATNSANVTVNQSVVAPETGQTVTGLWAIDGVTSTVTYGSAAAINLWNPATLAARCLTITGSSNDGAGAYTISGRDVYGYLMNEVIAGSVSTTAALATRTTQKAFKYISTITASGTINSTGVIIGVSDVVGFPLFVDRQANVQFANSIVGAYSLVTASTGIITGSTRATQTSTTPDVRGTFSSTTASDGTIRFSMFITPNPSAASNTAGLVGPNQYSTAS